MSKRKSESEYGHHEAPPTKKYRPDILPSLPPILPAFEKFVFTHPSAATSTNGEPVHYDRLEFIGDAHLELLASTMIYDTYPTATAGRMAQMRQQLVQNETLCQYSLMYGFDKRLKINSSSVSRKSGLTKIYGDVFEAYIGAIFRSDPVKGPVAAAEWLKALWEPIWSELLRKFPPDLSGQKEALAKKVLVPGVKLDYVEERKVAVHKGKGVETYYIGVYLTGWGYRNQHLGSGTAASKNQAGQEAAMAALKNQARMAELGAMKEEYLKARNEARVSAEDTKEAPGGGAPVR